MNLRNLTSLLLFLFIVGNSFSQYIQGAYEGEEIYGHYGANEVKNVPGDGYIMVGSITTIQPVQKNQVYVLRISDSLEQKWSRVIEVEGLDWANSVELTRGNGFLIAGTSQSVSTDKKYVYLIKLDASGVIEWSKHLGDKDYNQEGNAIKATDDGGFIIVGAVEKPGLGKNVYVVKLDADGTVAWSKSIGHVGNEIGYGVDTTLDGGYVIAGESDSFSAEFNDSYIIKLDADGNLEWTTLMAPNMPNIAQDVVATADGGYAVAGTYIGSGYILKLDSFGDISWWKGYGNPRNASYLNSITLMENGNVAAVGSSGKVTFLAVESTIDGEIRKGREFWGQEGFNGLAIDKADDGGIIVAGTKNMYRRRTNLGNKVYFIKTRPSFVSCVDSNTLMLTKLLENSDKRSGGVIQNEIAGLSDVVSIVSESLDITPVCSTVLNTDSFIKPTFSIYPNPAHNSFTIRAETLISRIEITTLDGRRIYSTAVQNNKTTVSTNDFSSGMYLVTIYTENGVNTKKVMVSKQGIYTLFHTTKSGVY